MLTRRLTSLFVAVCPVVSVLAAVAAWSATRRLWTVLSGHTRVCLCSIVPCGVPFRRNAGDVLAHHHTDSSRRTPTPVVGLTLCSSCVRADLLGRSTQHCPSSQISLPPSCRTAFFAVVGGIGTVFRLCAPYLALFLSLPARLRHCILCSGGWC